MKMLKLFWSQKNILHIFFMGTSCSISKLSKRYQLPFYRVQHSHLLRSILLASGVSPTQALCTDPRLWCLHDQLRGQKLLQENHTLLRFSSKTSSVSACHLTIKNHRAGNDWVRGSFSSLFAAQSKFPHLPQKPQVWRDYKNPLQTVLALAVGTFHFVRNFKSYSQASFIYTLSQQSHQKKQSRPLSFTDLVACFCSWTTPCFLLA